MVSKGVISDDEASLCSACTSESSDSHSYLLWDIENPSNHVNEEWEAIERTLYQEDGKQVTDPVLLKECQLWREAFLHLRARGTAIGTGKSAKNVQAVDDNQLVLSELNEKREKIRKEVVSQIVERLATKLRLNKEDSIGCTEKWQKDTDEKTVEKSPGTKADSESYFERGKPKVCGEDSVKNTNIEASTSFRSGAKSAFSNMSNDFATDILKSETNSRLWSGWSEGKRYLSKEKRFSSNMAKNEEILRSENLKFNISRKPLLRMETGTSDSLSSIAKPFKMTKKIDKKYGSMLERILDGKRVNASAGDKQSSPKPVKFGEKPMADPKPEEQKHRKNYKQLPKINNFTNNWMTRSEQTFSDPHAAKESVCEGIQVRTELARCGRALDGTSRSASNARQFDEGFFEDLKREMWIQKQSRAEGLGETSFKNPRVQHRSARTQKSSSCGDLQSKAPKVRELKSGLEKGRSDVLIKGRKTKNSKNAGRQNLQLPPIEANIICTEIMGKPKIPTRTLPKKYT